MADREKVVSHLQIIHAWAEFAIENPDIIFFTHDHHQRILEWTQDALNLLKEQQETRITVDANGIRADRVAHWKGFTQSRFYVCSNCRRKTAIKTPYCPQCGAKMDKEVKQDAAEG